MPAHMANAGRGVLFGKTAVVCSADIDRIADIQEALCAEDATVVATAVEGHSAARLALDRHPDVIIIDVRLPDGIGGVDVAALVLPQFETCVLLVGDADSALIDRAKRVGISGFVPDPTIAGAIVDSINTALSRFRCSVLDQIH